MLAKSLGDSWAIARHLWDSGRMDRPSTRSSAELPYRAEPTPGEVEAIGPAPSHRDPRGRLLVEQAGNGSCRVHIVVLGTISSGKTSLINALIRRSRDETATPMEETCLGGPLTREIRGVDGIITLTEIRYISHFSNEEGGEDEAIRLTTQADLLFLVVDHDWLNAESDLLSSLVARGERALVLLNKKDLLREPDLGEILARLRSRLAGIVPPEDVVAVAADPRPLVVRVRDHGGTEQSILEYEEPDLIALDERIEGLVSRETDKLRAANLLLRAYLLRKSEQEQIRHERRSRAEAIVERYQWMAAAATVAIPLPQFDLMATSAVEYQMISEVAAVYGADLSAEHIRLISQQMIQTLLKRRVIESALALVSGALKSSLIGYAAGGLIQAVTVAYLTRVTGLTFLDYFERGQNWGEGGIQSALARQFDINGRSEFLRDLFRHNFDKMHRWMSGFR